MIRTLQHRGPDATTTRIDGNVALAHSRLSIVDLVTGAQPISNEDGSVWVVLNGEIFNHVELRTELERQGHRFRSRSDTEVLVHLYEECGDELVHRLNGQFAFVLHDRRRQRVLIARDRVGIRPLYYTLTDDRLAFASEVKALFALPGVRRELDPAGLTDLFSLWSVIPPRTPFVGVMQLPPGHLMTVEVPRDGGVPQPHIRCWWDWRFPEEDAWLDTAPVSMEVAADELLAILDDAVRLQMRADVPVGAYLSGGLDSAGITALATRHHPDGLNTYALTFEDKTLDEGPWQRMLATHLGTRHHARHTTTTDIANALPAAVWHAESPLLRTAPAPMMLLSSTVRSHGGKVVLTGEGADEVFAGYDLFKEAKIRRFIARQPGSKWRQRLWERLYPYLKHSPTSHPALAQRSFDRSGDATDAPCYAHRPRMNTTARVQQFFSEDFATRSQSHDCAEALRSRTPHDFARWSPLNRDQYIEAHTLLSGNLLSSQGDRMAMANGVEGRVPFLDHRVIEFANRLPPNLKLQALTEKAVLRHALQKFLPTEIRHRPKQPYRAPDSACFFRDGKALDWVSELLSPESLNKAGVFDAPAIGRLLTKGASGKAIGFGDNMALVAAVTTMLTHRQFIEGDQPAGLAA